MIKQKAIELLNETFNNDFNNEDIFHSVPTFLSTGQKKSI